MGSKVAWLSRWVAAALCCGILGCGGPARPEPAAWRASWARVRALVPGERDLASGDAKPRCTALLAAIRQNEDALVPSPDPGLDAAVQAWLRRAEGLGFECPSGPAQRETRQAIYSDLKVIEAEIDAGLGRTGSG